MAVMDQKITDKYALYHGDCCEVMPQLKDESVHLSIYSPPFGGLYHYSSNERDLSNCDDYKQFFDHYTFVVREIARLTVPGRMTAVHCMDIPSGNSGTDSLVDFPGDIIRLHEREGFRYIARYAIWKEPLGVRNRTMAKNLAHKTIVDDSSRCSVASADWLLVFRKRGKNTIPIEHPTGLHEYAGEREIPAELHEFKGWKGKQTENRFSHWIWRQYASAFWDDIRLGRVLPYKQAREEDDEKHVHPLQLDVIDRVLQLWSNPGETVLTPFMGIGSEVYGAVAYGRRGIGVELKASYFRQAIKNVEFAAADPDGARKVGTEVTRPTVRPLPPTAGGQVVAAIERFDMGDLTFVKDQVSSKYQRVKRAMLKSESVNLQAPTAELKVEIDEARGELRGLKYAIDQAEMRDHQLPLLEAGR
jgi:DNA modification methylase